MGLTDSKPVANGLLGPAKPTEFEYFPNLLVRDLSLTVTFIREPLASPSFVTISNVVRVGPILQMIPVHAFGIVALVAAHLGPLAIVNKVGEPVGENIPYSPPNDTIAECVRGVLPFSTA